jgi:hypothetical protein
MTPVERLQDLRQAWADGRISLPRLVLELEGLVDEAREQLDEEVSRTALRAWGQLEIINALALDAGTALSVEDVRDANEELDHLQHALASGFRR